MNTLVTGGSGFLGKNILAKNKDYVGTYKTNKIANGYYCDLNKEESVKSLIKQVDPSVIIHCAANPSPKHPENYLEFINNHIYTTTNLLEQCKEGTKFVYISSILVYGDSFPEIMPSNLYGACKISCEEICKAYARLKKLQLKIIRPCAIVGPGLTHGLIFDIQRKLASESKELELFGDCPGTRKPFVHVDDVYHAIKLCLGNLSKICPDIIDCFPRDSATVEEVALAIMEEIGITKPIKWLGESTIWKGDNRFIDTSGSFEEFTLQYKTSLEAIRNAV